MIKSFREEIDVIERLSGQERKRLVEFIPRMAQAVEYLAKALIYALNVDEGVCKDVRRKHDVYDLLIEVCRASPVSLTWEEVKAIAGIAILNAMFCNSVTWSVARYGLEGLGVRFSEVTRKSKSVLEGWEDILENVVRLLRSYSRIVEQIIRKANTFVVEVTKHDFEAVEDRKSVIKRICKLRPTASYAHARIRIRFVDELLSYSYRVSVKFKCEENLKVPVRCEVCLWDRFGKLVNGYKGSPKDYIYLTGGEGTVVVRAGRVGFATVSEIEPRVWNPGGVKEIEIRIEKENEV